MTKTKFFIFLSFVIILTSCQMIPSQSVSVKEPDSHSEKGFAIQSAQTTPTGLVAVKKPAKGKSFQFRLNTKPIKNKNNPKHIQVPQQGKFKLILQAGSQFKFLDANATDGFKTGVYPEGG